MMCDLSRLILMSSQMYNNVSPDLSYITKIINTSYTLRIQVLNIINIIILNPSAETSVQMDT